MADIAHFQLRLSGGSSDGHEFQAYDGYNALAGFAWMLSLVANYTQTGEIRHKGNFVGRHAVRAGALREGSIITDFWVQLTADPALVFTSFTGTVIVTSFLYSTVKRVIDRNIGIDQQSQDPLLHHLILDRGGDVEALVAICESPIRRSHEIINNGAENIEIMGGHNIINTFNSQTKDYVNRDVWDEEIRTKEVSMAAFNANSGYGSVFDPDLRRTIPIHMDKNVLIQYRNIFTWGLDQYANSTGNRITISYQRILAMDGRPKKYFILSARRE